MAKKTETPIEPRLVETEMDALFGDINAASKWADKLTEAARLEAASKAEYHQRAVASYKAHKIREANTSFIYCLGYIIGLGCCVWLLTDAGFIVPRLLPWCIGPLLIWLGDSIGALRCRLKFWRGE